MKGKNVAIKQGKKLASKYFPDPSEITKDNMYQIVPDLNAIAYDLNISIIYHDFSNDISGVFIRDKNNNYIGINEHDTPARQRFTIAHEIGHHMLHSTDTLHYDNIPLDVPPVVLYRSNNNSNYNEVEANAFAAELLMPDDVIEKVIQLGVEVIDELANIFKVSPDAMRYRLINLGYI